MTVELIIVLAVVVLLVVIAMMWWRQHSSSKPNVEPTQSGKVPPKSGPDRVKVKEPAQAAVIVPDTVDPAAFSRDAMGALRSVNAPVAVAYEPVTADRADALGAQSVPLTGTSLAVRSLSQIVQTAKIQPPTGGAGLYRVILPNGHQLASAIGGGYRGFASGPTGIISSARLVPVGAKAGVVGGVALTGPPGWAVLAVVASTMVLDAMARRQQLAFQRRVEDQLAHMEDERRRSKIARLQAVSNTLDLEIARLLDGLPTDPSSVKAYQDAQELLHYSETRVREWRDTLGSAITYRRQGDEETWTADHKKIRNMLQVDTAGQKPFMFELTIAEAMIPVSQKAVTAYAAGTALLGPGDSLDHLQAILSQYGRGVMSFEDGLNSVIRDLNRIDMQGSKMLAKGDQKLQRYLRENLEFLETPTSEARPLEILQKPDGTMHQLTVD